MPYDHDLADRIRKILGDRPSMVEKKMFGGVGFMLRGNMACGVWGDELIVRIGEAANDAALALPHVRPFMPVPGRPMAGWVLVGPQATASETDFQRWVEQGYDYASSLPEKK